MDEIIIDDRRFFNEVSAVKVASSEKKLVVLVYEKELDTQYYRVFTRDEYKALKKLGYGVGFCTLEMKGWMSIKDDFIEKNKK